MRNAYFQSMETQKAMVLCGVQAEGRVIGRMLDMHLAQTFQNRDNVPTEVLYTFPLPYGAVLLGLTLKLKGETLTGAVRAKAEARSQYEEALSEGNSGLLVSMNPDGTCTLEIGNLLPGEDCGVHLHYVQVLQPGQDSLRLMLPTTIAPRHGYAVQHGGYEPHAVPQVSSGVEYPFHIHLSVMGELALARIGSPSHPVSIHTVLQSDTQAAPVADIRLGAHAWLDRDFVLQFDQLEGRSLGLAAWDAQEAVVGIIQASFTPVFPQDVATDLPVTVKVLVDCSASMAGDSIQAARRALQGVIERLTVVDRFSLSRFGSTVEHRSKALWKAAPAALAAARRWAETLDADLGETEMVMALHATLGLPGAKACDVLLVTDGEVHAIDAVVEAARNSGHRFFVVGIGSSVAEGLLRRLANETGGSCEFVAPGEEVEGAILRLFGRMRSTVVTRTRVQWPSGCELLSATELPASVFHGDDITLYARLKADEVTTLTGPVRLYGRLKEGGPETCLAELVPTYIVDHANTLARLAASERYRRLKQSPATTAEDRDSLPALAETYQLVTEDTSFVLVKERQPHEQAQDMPELRQVPGMLAAGWGGTGSVLASGQGATYMDILNKSVRRSEAQSSSPSVPSVWRKPYDRNTRRDPTALRGMEDFEIPAFLRKDASKKSSLLPPNGWHQVFGAQSKVVWRAPAKEPAFWNMPTQNEGTEPIEWAGCSGLTPAGLVEGLRLNDLKYWPVSYEDLASIGLGQRILDWLDVVIAEGEPGTEVVQAFLEAMSQMDFTFRQSMAGAMRKLSGFTLSDRPEQQQLRERIANALEGITATAWPASVLDFAEVGQGA
jgi:Ca-activated chloride channel homolog